jgi:DNA-directed RNA polymerase specialized sigma24 family protein
MSAEGGGSITVCIDAIKGASNEAANEAAEAILDRYWDKLIQQARRHLRGRPGMAADEEDAVLSAFDSLFRRARQGKFKRLEDRDDLGRLLFWITKCKALKLIRDDRAGIRGGGYDLRLMSLVKDTSGIPTTGESLIIVAAVDHVLHFRGFAGDGKAIVDTDEKRLTHLARQIEDFRKQLESLWPPHELSKSEKAQVIEAVTSIVGQTRGGGRRVLRESELDGGNDGGAAPDQVEGAGPILDGLVIDAEPSPESVAIFAEEVQHLLDMLGGDHLRQVALLKLEGHTDEEIARKMGVVRRTIVRWLRMIREIWRGEIE